MSFVLPPAPTAGSSFVQGLTGGVETGLNSSMQSISEMILNRKKQKRVGEILGLNPSGEDIASNSPEVSKDQNLMNGLQLGIDSEGQKAQSNQLNLTPEKVFQLNDEGFHQEAQLAAKLLDVQQKSGEHKREFDYKRAGKVLEDADQASSIMPERRTALNASRDAIQRNDVGFFSPSNISSVLSQITGINLPLDASGAQLASAGKNMLITSLSKVGGGRPNQFIEQQIVQAYPKIGQSKEANMAAFLPAEASLDLEEKYLEAIDQLDAYYMKTQGSPPADIARQARQLIKPWVQERMQKLEGDLKENISAGKKEKNNTFSSLEGITSEKKPQRGDQARNKKTGEKFVWDGKEWKKASKK